MEFLVLIIIGTVIYFVAKNNKKGRGPIPPPKSYARASSSSEKRYEDNSDNNLVEVTIRFGDDDTSHSYNRGYYNERISSKEIRQLADKAWIIAGEQNSVQGVSLSIGNIYVGEKLPNADRYYAAENCLINPSLKVTRIRSHESAPDLPYWPSYSEISPLARGYYLDWLSSGASNPETPLGYVFLYFYGLERRLILDQSISEASDLVREIVRLLGIYGENRSFNRYATAALEAATIIYGDILPEGFEIEASSWEMPIAMRVRLGSKLARGEVLVAEDLLDWFMASPEKQINTAARRLNIVFRDFLLKEIQAKMPTGLKVRAPKRRLSYIYRASSGSFTKDCSSDLKDIPDIASIKGPVSKIQDIANPLMDQLVPLGRFAKNNAHAIDTPEAIPFYPRGSVTEAMSKFHDCQERVRTWAPDGKGFVKVFELCALFAVPVSDSISVTLHRRLVSGLEAMGYGMVPGVNERIGPLRGDQKAYIFQTLDWVGEDEQKQDDYQSALFKLYIASAVSHSDGNVHESEVGLLRDHATKFHIPAASQMRLSRVVEWLSIAPPKLSILLGKLKSVPAAEKTTIAHLTVAVAGADGRLDPKEVSVLEKIYAALDLEESQLFSALHMLSAGSFDATASAMQNVVTNYPTEGESKRTASTMVTLDMAKVAATLDDTKEASALLASIFADDQVEESEPEEDITENTPQYGDDFSGLDATHRQLLTELLAKSVWSRAEFEHLAEGLSLMPDGALEIINDWSFDKFDDAIIDDGDQIEVYKHLLDERIE